MTTQSTPIPTPLPDAASPAHAVALVTGANKGLGLETTRRLTAYGWTVWLGARDTAAGQAAAERVREEQPGADVRVVALDVTDDASVAAAVATVTDAGTGLDVLVNNAGVATGYTRDAVDTTADDVVAIHTVNVLGPVRVTHAFLPLLRASATPRLVMVSSGLGKLAHVRDPGRSESAVPGFAYQSSKAALDMVADRYAAAVPDVRVTTCDPGYTATDLNAHAGHQSVTEGTDAIVLACVAESVPAAQIDRFGPVVV